MVDKKVINLKIELANGMCKNLTAFEGVTLTEVAKQVFGEEDKEYVAAFEDGRLRELHAHVNHSADIRFVSVHSNLGFDLYKRSLILLMLKATSDVLKDENSHDVVKVLYSLGKGFFCTAGENITEERISAIGSRMRALAEKNIKLEKKSVSVRKAKKIFEERGLTEKARLLKYRRSSKINLYQLDDYSDYFYGYMVPSTGYLSAFDIVPYEDGFVLVLPDQETLKVLPYKAPQKLYQILRKSEDWGDALGIDGVGELNDIIVEGRMNEVMLMQEALMEKQIADIAERIREEKRKIILIAGPSSSGKTTFSRRLSIQLIAHGLSPHPISMDNFFKERVDTPKLPNGKYDFESLAAVDLELFNKDMKALLDGEKVDMPNFDFMSGEKIYSGDVMQMGPNDVLVVEGIHALNPASTYALPAEQSFKIYISALTQLNVDEHNRISTTDTRLLRRIVRDARTRGNDAARSIEMWPSVRAGEEENIFPFQEEADVMFNSALIYELSAIKIFAEPLLFAVPEDSDAYYEAKRLLKFLDYFLGIDASSLPQNSLMREFIGGGCFKI